MSWLSAPALAGLPGLPKTSHGVILRSKSAGWAKRPRSGPGRSGFEYLSTDLPPETQQALAAQAAGAIKPAVDALAAGQRAKEVAQVTLHPLKATLTRCRHGQALVVLESEPFNGLEMRPGQLRALAQQLTAIADMADSLPTHGKHWRATPVSVDANGLVQKGNAA